MSEYASLTVLSLSAAQIARIHQIIDDQDITGVDIWMATSKNSKFEIHVGGDDPVPFLLRYRQAMADEFGVLVDDLKTKIKFESSKVKTKKDKKERG